MRRIFLFYFFIGWLSISAQQTALNWIKPECGHGASVNLFDVLDSGKVVVCDYVMLGSCVQCGYSSQEIEGIVNQFNILNPGKVVFYSTAYDSSYACSDMNTWKQSFNLNNTVFKDGTLEFNYYGGFGMPLVVVLGTSSHSVFTVINGYYQSDSTNLKNAIADAIILSGTEKINLTKKVRVFPSPANEEVTIQTNSSELKSCFIYDNLGRIVKTFTFSSEKIVTNLEELSEGFYNLLIQYADAEVYSKFVITR